MKFEKQRSLENTIFEYGVAEGLYQDDFLAEDVYEDWTQSQRQDLWQKYLLMAHCLAKFYLERGDYSAAIAMSRRILHRDNSQEKAHLNLMRCYLAQGQRNLALSQYRMCVQALDEGLGLEPSPETQNLYRQIILGRF